MRKHSSTCGLVCNYFLCTVRQFLIEFVAEGLILSFLFLWLFINYGKLTYGTTSVYVCLWEIKNGCCHSFLLFRGLK